MNKLAHVLFPVCTLAAVDGPKEMSAFAKNYYFATASWLSILPPDLVFMVLLIAGTILPDYIDRIFSGHKTATHLQHRKDRGEWLSEADFNEMLGKKRTWWAIHRTFSHWWPIPFILYFTGLQPLAIGWASHLILDAMTPMGIPKLAPIPKDKEAGYMRVPFLSNVKALEALTTFALCAAYGYLFIYL